MDRVLVHTEALQSFVATVLEQIGLSAEHARITADVLLSADRRGVESHTIARLKWYVDGIKSGVILASPEVRTFKGFYRSIRRHSRAWRRFGTGWMRIFAC